MREWGGDYTDKFWILILLLLGLLVATGCRPEPTIAIQVPTDEWIDYGKGVWGRVLITDTVGGRCLIIVRGNDQSAGALATGCP